MQAATTSPVGAEGGISLTTTMFTKDVFKQALEAYYKKTNNQNFYNNFLSKVDELYDSSVANDVNPELVVVTAKCEGGFQEAGGSFNYWGIGVANGSSSGASYSSLGDGIKGYSDTLKEYREGGKYEATITARYEERKNSGCDAEGYGMPGTLSGMQSIYSDLGKHEYGSSGSGGYYYMDPARAGVTKIYSTHEEFENKCLNVDGEHAEGTQCTNYERGQYTAWQVEEKINTWNDIFGDFGTLSYSNAGNSTTDNSGKGEIGGTEKKSGSRAKGYTSVFTTGTRTYKNYKQGSGAPWENTTYRVFSPETIGESGCSITTVAVIATGFGHDVTPADVEARAYSKGNYMPSLLSYYTGMNVSYEYSNIKSGLIKQLKNGYPALVHVTNHFFAILGINENETKFYASEVGGYYEGQNKNGWINIDTVMNYKGGITYYSKMTKK